MKSVRFYASVAVLTMGSLGLSKASAPIYEGFNYTSGQNITTLTSTATGLSGNWTSTNAHISGNTDITGLTFGNLVTTGGSLDVLSTAGANTYAFLDAPVGISIAPGSSLYASYLFQYNGAGGNGTNANFGVSAGTVAATNHDFALLEGSYASSPTAGRIGYDDTTNNTLTYSENINSGNTYMFIGEWTNLGGTSTGTGWVLNLADFNAISGSVITDSILTANSIAHASIASGAAHPGQFAANFNTSDFVKIGDFMDANANYKVDELRFSSNLADVVPVAVPEPSSYAIFIGAGCLGLVALRRRQMVRVR